MQIAPSTVPLANNASVMSLFLVESRSCNGKNINAALAVPAGLGRVCSEISASSGSLASFQTWIFSLGTVVHNCSWLYWQFGGFSECSGWCLALNPSPEQERNR